MPIKVIRERLPRPDGVSPLVLCKWAMAKVQADRAADEMKELRPQLADFFAHVEPDADGHRWADLPEEVEGVARIQYQRRVSNKPDPEAVERILSQHGLLDRCTKVEHVVKVDEEEVMAAMYEGLLSEEEVSQMYPQTVTHAVVCKRG